jgi:AmiR/NasT family two-component response regulator
MSVQSDKILRTTPPREVISQALSLLRAKHGVSEAVAFEMLVSGSSDSHERVLESASRIVAESHQLR